MPRSYIVHNLTSALHHQQVLGFPTILHLPWVAVAVVLLIIAKNLICERGFDFSPTHELLLDESLPKLCLGKGPSYAWAEAGLERI